MAENLENPKFLRNALLFLRSSCVRGTKIFLGFQKSRIRGTASLRLRLRLSVEFVILIVVIIIRDHFF